MHAGHRPSGGRVRRAGAAGRARAVVPLGAAQTLSVAAFTVKLQHHVGLDVVQQNLISVVYQAFQPTQVAMYLIRELDPIRRNSDDRAG